MRAYPIEGSEREILDFSLSLNYFIDYKETRLHRNMLALFCMEDTSISELQRLAKKAHLDLGRFTFMIVSGITVEK